MSSIFFLLTLGIYLVNSSELNTISLATAITAYGLFFYGGGLWMLSYCIIGYQKKEIFIYSGILGWDEIYKGTPAKIWAISGILLSLSFIVAASLPVFFFF